MSKVTDLIWYLISVLIIPFIFGYINGYDYFTVYAVTVGLGIGYLILANIHKTKKLLEDRWQTTSNSQKQRNKK